MNRGPRFRKRRSGRPGLLVGTLLAITAALVVLSAALTIAAFGDGDSDEPNVTGDLPPCEWARVINVVDGDTIDVTLEANGEEERVRYIGIDTPERRGSEPFAEEARDANLDLVEDERVCMERDVSDRDAFGRLLRYVYLADGRMVNEEIVRQGMARVATFPPDVQHIEPILRPAQVAAQDERLGIWEDFEPLPPPTEPPCFEPGDDGCNCGDFETQAEAQAFHDAFDPGDANRLDTNGDGIVCESLP